MSQSFLRTAEARRAEACPPQPCTAALDEHVFLAKLAEQAERYDKMAEHMRLAVALASGDLNLEQRNLFSVAFKNLAGARRASLRILDSLAAKQQRESAAARETAAASGSSEQDAIAIGDGMVQQREHAAASGSSEQHAALVGAFRAKIRDELLSLCTEVIETVDTRLLPDARGPEAKLFYHRMKADYWRYMAEFSADAEKQQCAERADRAYADGVQATKQLHPTYTQPGPQTLPRTLATHLAQGLKSWQRTLSPSHAPWPRSASMPSHASPLMARSRPVWMHIAMPRF